MFPSQTPSTTPDLLNQLQLEGVTVTVNFSPDLTEALCNPCASSGGSGGSGSCGGGSCNKIFPTTN